MLLALSSRPGSSPVPLHAPLRAPAPSPGAGPFRVPALRCARLCGVARVLKAPVLEAWGALARRGAVVASGGCSASLRAIQSVPTLSSAWAGAGAHRLLCPRTCGCGSCWGLGPRREKPRCDPSLPPRTSIAFSGSCASHSPLDSERLPGSSGRESRPPGARHRGSWAAVIQLHESRGLGDQERKAQPRGLSAR